MLTDIEFPEKYLNNAQYTTQHKLLRTRMVIPFPPITCFLCLVIHVMVMPGLGVVLLAILYSSIWAPQIVRAVRCGRPCALERKYIIGTTVGRMLLAMYMHPHSAMQHPN